MRTYLLTHSLHLQSFYYRLMLLALLVFTSFGMFSQCLPDFESDSDDITVTCGEPLPQFGVCSASSDCCEGPVTVTTFTSETGAVIHDCTISTAAGPGVDWAIWLPMIEAPSVAWNFVGEGHFETYADGTAHVWGTVANAGDGTLQMEVEMWLDNGSNWAEWSALGRTYKNDLGFAESNYVDWTYFELVAGFSRLTGIGSLSGTYLELHHQPADYFYGFQTGLGANNKNGNEGMSGWFTYDGMFAGESVSGHGDINVNQDCTDGPSGCAATAFTQICRAEDSCGGVSFTDQTVAITDLDAPVIDAYETTISVECAAANNIYITAIDVCSTVTITFTDTVIEAGCPGQVIRHYTVTDGCGNTTTANQTINILSEGELEFTLFPEDISISCDEVENLDPEVEWNAVCANTELTITENIIAGNCISNYIIEYTYTLTDACDNEVSQVWTVTVSDSTKPLFFDVPAPITISCGDEIPQALPFAVDNCSEVNITLEAVTIEQECGYNFIRTWTAIDACGNEETASQNIYVSDNIDPFYTFLPPSVTIGCNEPFSLDLAIVEDLCSTVSLTYSDVPLGDCAGSYIRVWRAFDGCGNQAIESTTVNLIDDQAPVMTSFPEDITVNCGEVPTVESANIEYADVCGSVTATYAETTSDGDCANGYVIMRTWTLSDDCDNTSVWTWEISVSDNQAPTLVGVPEDTEANCGDEVSEAVVVAIDNCDDEVQVSLEATTEESECGYLFIRTWTAVDACGNTASESQVITVNDLEDPIFTFVPENIAINCGDGVSIDDLPIAEATDDCSFVEVTFTDAPIGGNCGDGLLRTFTATDGCGNTATAEQVISYSDEVAPEFTFVPENASVPCGSDLTFDLPMAQATDNCSTVEITFVDTPSDGCAGSFIRVYTATDGCGNTATANVSVTYADNEAPALIGVPEDITLDCNDEVSVAVVEAIDACDDNVEVSLSAETIQGECGYTFIRTWTATDLCGNSASESQIITVIDEVPPTFTFVPASVDLGCDGSGEGSSEPATAEDNCSSVTVTFEDEFTTGDCAGGFIRHWIATDGCGNFVVEDQLITSSDQSAPVITAFPADLTTSCFDIPTAESAVVEYSDDCGNVITEFAETITDGQCAHSYVIERTWTFTDGCGNSISGTWTIYVVDEQAPQVFGVPSDITIGCGDPIEDAVITAIDNCSAPEDITISLSATTTPTDCGSIFIRVWTVIDECGNSTVLAQEITITDNEDPQFTFVPASFTVNCGEPYELQDATAEDDCSSVVVTTEILGSNNCSEGLIRQFTATDGCGNTAVAQQIITIDDNTPPVALNVPPAEMFIDCNEVFPVDASYVTFDDACSNVEVLFEEDYLLSDCPGSFSIFYSWTALDECGNSDFQSMVVYYIDQTAPQFTQLPADVVLECGDELPTFDISVADDCSEVLIESEDEILTTGCGLQIVRTYTATDACGNWSEHVQLITYVDDTAPQFDFLPENLSISCTDPIPAVVIPTVTDFCSFADVEFSETTIPGACPNSYTIVREYVASDVCGNESTHIQTIIVTDDTAPVFNNFESEITVQCALSNGVFATVSDDCSTSSVVYSDVIIDGSCGGSILRTYVATDACGNSSEAGQIINLIDEDAPEFLSFPEDGNMSCSEVPTVDEVVIEYFDNCSAVDVDYNEVITPGDCPNSYLLERTWVISDVCGNSTTRTWTINVSDNEAPEIFGVPDDITLDCGDLIPSVAVFAFDNCTAEPVITLTATEEIIGCNTLFTRRWTAIDECGNLSQEVQVITITDLYNPTLSEYPGDLVLTCGDELPAAPAVTAVDNCVSNVEVIFSETSEGGLNCPTVTRTWCATDCVGNEECHTQTITFTNNNGGPAQNGAMLKVWQQSSANALIQVTPGSEGRWGIDIFDITGKLVSPLFAGEMKSGETRLFDFNISDLKDSMYFVRFSNGNTMVSQGIAIVR